MPPEELLPLVAQADAGRGVSLGPPPAPPNSPPPPEPPAQPAAQAADAVVEQGSIVDTEAVTRYWTEGFVYLGLAADLGVAGVPETTDPATERRRRATQE